jgi:hypothetical protein
MKENKRKGENIPITRLLSYHNQANTPFIIVPYKAPQFRDVGIPFKANSLRG